MIYIVRLIPDIFPNRVKVGFAKNVRNRLNAIKTTNPTAVLCKTYFGGEWIERLFHKYLRGEASVYHVGGEVYDIDPFLFGFYFFKKLVRFLVLKARIEGGGKVRINNGQIQTI